MNPEQQFEGLVDQPKFEHQTADFSAAELERMELVCDNFENAWKSGSPADIESSVSEFDGKLKSLLFAELLELDIHYRCCQGQTPTQNDYESRFPEQSTVIESVFRYDPQVLGGRSRTKPGNRIELTDLSFTSHFRLQKFHARGGLGIVYSARDKEFGREVAVKLPRNSIEESTANRRLAREAKITGRLEHPGIVSVYATGHHPNGSRCYVMQMIEGETLQEVIKRVHDRESKIGIRVEFQSLEFRQILQRFVAVCQTAAYGHDHHVIHRDIKPSNIMLGRYGETFLLDWGLAKEIDNSCEVRDDVDPELADVYPQVNDADEEMTAPGQCMGTPGFASPEQLAGDVGEHGIRCDIYSLGATLYCLLVGHAPGLWEDKNDASEGLNVRRPRTIDPTIPRQLDAICWKAIALDPSQRYESVQSLIDDLERYLADEPVKALNDSRIVKARRWCRKHPRLTAGIAATVLVAMTSFAASSYLLNQKNKDLVASSKARELARVETMSALRSMSSEVIEHWMARQESLTDENRAFIESILTKYETFANLQTEQDDAFEIRAEGCYRVGLLNRMLGRDQKAIEVWQRGIGLVPATELDSVAVRLIIAKMQNNLGDSLTDQGEFKEAELHLLESSQLIEDVVPIIDESTDLIVLRSLVFRNLGELYWSQGRYVDAVDSCQQALDSVVSVVEPKQTESILFQKEFAGATHDLALVLNLVGRNSEADKHLRQSRELHRLIVDRTKQVQYRIDLGLVCQTSGKVSRDLNDLKSAESHIDDSVDVLKRVTEEYPLLSKPIFLLANSQNLLASLKVRRRNEKEAIRYCELAQEYFAKGIEQNQAETAIPFRYLRESHRLHGAALELAGKNVEAEKQYEQALRISEEEFNSSNSFANRERLLYSLTDLCSLMSRQLRWSEVKVHAQQMCNLFDDSESVDQEQLFKLEVNCNMLMGYSLTFEGKLEEAGKHWIRLEEMFQLRSFGNTNGEDLSITASVMRALCFARTRPDETLEYLKSILTTEDFTTTQIYNLSCAAGMASQFLKNEPDNDEAEEIALSYLERAFEAGHFKHRSQIASLKGNPSFRSLFQNEAFKQIEMKIVASFD